MKWAVSAFLFLVLGAGAALPVQAQIARLDDSTSPRAVVQVDMAQARPAGANAVQLPLGRIEYRLATAPYVGRSARIYYVIPLQTGAIPPGGLTLHWQGGRYFSSGSGRPGDRVPVWTGRVEGPWMTDTLDVSLQFDQGALRRMHATPSLALEPHFEIEVLP